MLLARMTGVSPGDACLTIPLETAHIVVSPYRTCWWHRLFRNFLLAERIMRAANCSPVSHPRLPPTHQHHMWLAWDMAAEICLLQLPQCALHSPLALHDVLGSALAASEDLFAEQTLEHRL